MLLHKNGGTTTSIYFCILFLSEISLRKFLKYCCRVTTVGIYNNIKDVIVGKEVKKLKIIRLIEGYKVNIIYYIGWPHYWIALSENTTERNRRVRENQFSGR